MDEEQRRSVLDNARYLREVRPIDPEEVCEYVSGQPHPGAVRIVLREHAFELGLHERDDGTFVPVDADPVEPDFRGVDAFPDRYGRRLEDLLVEEYGPGWPEGTSGDRLRERIRRLKAAYYRQRTVEYDYDTALAYGIYHLPASYAAVQYVLAELVEDGLLPRQTRVLDVGAGVGGPALGVHDFYPDESLVDYHAIEPGAGAEVFEALSNETRPNFRVTIHRRTAEAFDPGELPGGGEYDLMLFANVLSELDDAVAVLDTYLDHLAPDGSLVAIAPADRNTAVHLREVERAFDDEYTVYAPTVRLWPDESPTDLGWSFDVKHDLEVPSFQRRLETHSGDSDGTFVNVDVQYAFFVLRRDGKRAIECTPDPARSAKMAESETHVTDRIRLVAVKVSHDLSEDGNPLYKVTDGSEAVDHYAVLTRGTSLNRDLREADYGDLLSFENVLVLWNDDEAAYNLVVDEETVVDRLSM